MQSDSQSGNSNGSATTGQYVVRDILATMPEELGYCSWMMEVLITLPRYGVTRIYNQQCGYTLLDAQSMRDRMVSMLKLMSGGGLDPNVGKVK